MEKTKWHECAPGLEQLVCQFLVLKAKDEANWLNCHKNDAYML